MENIQTKLTPWLTSPYRLPRRYTAEFSSSCSAAIWNGKSSRFWQPTIRFGDCEGKYRPVLAGQLAEDRRNDALRTPAPVRWLHPAGFPIQPCSCSNSYLFIYFFQIHLFSVFRNDTRVDSYIEF